MSLFESGVSALLANQRALATASHNIANVNTPGYSRQRVNLTTREAQIDEGGFRGKGVKVVSIDRIVDEFTTRSVRTSTANEAYGAKYLERLSAINDLLADDQAGITPTLTSLFSGLQDLSNDPASMPVRDVVLSELNAVVARFDSMDARLAEMEDVLNREIEAGVNDLRDLATAVANINGEISAAYGRSSGATPNDLLDQRDELIRRMSEITRVSVVTDPRGVATVSIGTGQLLVAGPVSNNLTTVPNALDAGRLEVAYDIDGTISGISDLIQGGSLGALLNFREEVLYPARNDLSRIAVGLTQSLNAQHRQGMDLEGNLGADLLSIAAPTAVGLDGNTGTVGLAFASTSPGALTGADYSLIHNGTDFSLTNLSTGTVSTLSGAGPFTFDGLTLTITSAAAAGDTYLLRPTYGLARTMDRLVDRPAELAAALPILTGKAQTNTGTGIISSGTVLDVTNAALQTPVQLVFNSTTTYQVNGAGPSIAYTAGANIDLNGWRVQLTGSPRVGDSFSISGNNNGAGDNRNALALVGLQTRDVLDGNTATLSESYNQFVSGIGARQRQAEISHTALATVLDRSVAAQQETSGVNLDEEAANLLRFQQAYQAAAQIIAAADTVFQALINATAR